MSIKINNIHLSINEDISVLRKKVVKKLKINDSDIKEFKIIKESIDARKKNDIKFNYALEVVCDNEKKLISRLKDKDVLYMDKAFDEEIPVGDKVLEHRPVVVGLGPAGLFAALLLARKGYRPIVFERGEDVDNRSKTVDKFWTSGILNTESNVQFGEGGAGAFSDGKLTTRIKDKRCDFVVEALVNAGAPEEIMYMGKPHVGTDILKGVVKNIREEIKSLGGEVHFNSRVEKIVQKNGAVSAVIVNGNEVPCTQLILAIGHSSRDTYEMLNNIGVFMEPKPFAIGVRVEHLQELISRNQYGDYYNHPKLRTADYRLTHKAESTGRPVYSFCMCPGGVVVGAASEENRLVVNGMSYHARDKRNANSAIVVGVGPDDFEGNSPLKAMEFQRHYEELAYNLGGGKYIAPAQKISDFVNGNVTTKLGSVEPSVNPGYDFKDLTKCLPDYVSTSLKEGFVNFDRKIKGFGPSGDGVMIGIETRTSAPVKITRNDRYESISLKGMYPAGEGAGFAGGIISAAVDGLRIAETIISQYRY